MRLLRIMQMKWWGWLTIAISGSIVWVGISLIAESLGMRGARFPLGGIIIICTVCVALPLVFKAIKSAEDGTDDHH